MFFCSLWKIGMLLRCQGIVERGAILPEQRRFFTRHISHWTSDFCQQQPGVATHATLTIVQGSYPQHFCWPWLHTEASPLQCGSEPFHCQAPWVSSGSFQLFHRKPILKLEIKSHVLGPGQKFIKPPSPTAKSHLNAKRHPSMHHGRHREEW